MSKPVVGIQPWFPGAMGRSAWWNAPVPAERLAALRIGTGLMLLLDYRLSVGTNYFAFFGERGLSLTPPEPHGIDQLLGSVLTPDSTPMLFLAAMLWFFIPLGLVVGFFSRFWALLGWLLAVRFYSLNPTLHNGGDAIKILILFFLMLSPCGAAWSLDALRRGRRHPDQKQVLVHPWPIRLILIQLCFIYFGNGIMKLLGPDWRQGTAMHYVLADLSLVRLSPNRLPLPEILLRIMDWTVLTWEMLFPILLLRPTLYQIALTMGILFHLSNIFLLELGMFPIYMLCLYLPLFPWGQSKQAEERSDSI